MNIGEITSAKWNTQLQDYKESDEDFQPVQVRLRKITATDRAGHERRKASRVITFVWMNGRTSMEMTSSNPARTIALR
jgi:hypothetical protein